LRERVAGDGDGAAAAASTARSRAAARPVPKAGEDGVASTGAPRANGSPPLGAGNIGAIPYGPGNTGPIQYGSPTGAAPSSERSTRPSPVVREQPRGAPPVVEAAPQSAREACGKRTFIALAVCMDRTCEEARFRATPECVGVLARKTARENR
jgi:hypothetical protein